jgi:hypothetical protein
MSVAVGTRAGDQFAGFDQAPVFVLMIVGAAQKSGMLCGRPLAAWMC